MPVLPGQYLVLQFQSPMCDIQAQCTHLSQSIYYFEMFRNSLNISMWNLCSLNLLKLVISSSNPFPIFLLILWNILLKTALLCKPADFEPMEILLSLVSQVLLLKYCYRYGSCHLFCVSARTKTCATKSCLWVLGKELKDSFMLVQYSVILATELQSPQPYTLSYYMEFFSIVLKVFTSLLISNNNNALQFPLL